MWAERPDLARWAILDGVTTPEAPRESETSPAESSPDAASTPEATAEPTPEPTAEPTPDRQSVPKLRPAVAAAGRMVASGGRTAIGAARRPQGRLVAGGLFITAIVTAVVLGAVLLAPSGGVPAAQGSTTSGQQPTSAASSGTDLPSFSPPPTVTTSPPPPNAGLTEWAEKLAVKVEIPPVALRAYAYAEYVLTSRKPSCNVRWSTIAAIGKVETDHGRVGASTLGPDGRVLPPIVGPALDGKAGRAKVADTDAGALDNDRAWDHAVGPLQFLPATWRTYAIDADGDGIVDPNDIDDAALAVATKLCEANKDLSQAANWNAAIKTFPDLVAKVQQVYDAANAYGTKSRT
jgi:Transglycosylase SLT domain